MVINWTLSKLMVASKIAQLDLIHNNMNMSDIAREVNVSTTNPAYKKLIKEMIYEGIVIKRCKIGSSIILDMDKNKFVNSVINTNIWECIEKLVSTKNRFWGLYKI